MAKQTKPKLKRTQVKDLSVAQQELTVDEASQVKGGARDEMQNLTIKGGSDNDKIIKPFAGTLTSK